MAETFAEIKQLARDLCNIQSTDEMSDTTLAAYVNNAYQNKLPSVISLSLDRTWRFSTLPYIAIYAVGSEFRIIEGTVRVNGESIRYFTDPNLFHSIYPDSWENDQSLATGDGITTAFTGTLSGSYRLVPETVVLGDDTESFIDDGDGTLTGSEGGSGTVNYTTGAVSVTFNTAPGDGIAISASFSVYNESEPQAVLYTNADTDDDGEPELVFRPIPDSTYNIEVDYEARPDSLSSDSDEPIKKVWGDLIAYMAAIDITERFGDFDQSAQLMRGYNRCLDVVHSSEAVIMRNMKPIPRW